MRTTAAALLLLLILLPACSGNNSSTPANNPATAAVKPADENAALETIMKINDAQLNYFKRNRRYALTFDELVEAHLLNSEPAAETGYEFKLRPAADAQTYKLSVTPAASASNARHFFTDQTGVVHAETGKDATAESPST